MKKILFTGFMASILTIAGAYADSPDPLTTKAYVDGGVNYAISTSEAYTDAEIADLDANISVTAASNNGLALGITEVDGKITGITGSIAAGTYDASGAAAAVETGVKSGTIVAAEATKATRDGNGDEISTTYLKDADLSGYATEDYVGQQIASLDGTATGQTGSSTNGGLTLNITQTDGIVTAISGSVDSTMYDAAGAATNAVNALDGGDTQVATENNGWLALSVTQTNGVVTEITGSVDSSKFVESADLKCGTTGGLCLIDDSGDLIPVDTINTWTNPVSGSVD